MKKVLKLTLAVVCVMFSTSLFAQKMGRINTQELILSMNEYKDLQTQMESYQKELAAQAETIQVEFNTKYQEYQKNFETMTDAVKQLKEKELSDLQTRSQEFQQMAQQDLQKKYSDLMAPIEKKAIDAINEVSKAGGYAVVFDMSAGPIIYFDEASVIDLGPEVKTKLGVSATATPAAAPAQ
ncbi:MAG: OmpH family outer membrane protein [Alistipes sp.]|jgi:outer membrane protein|nr:OmpH family outer membrane protein [Alistipes sp.]MBQ5875631.1 OmpH family outer membrane protein [Alistipes sp.]